MTEAGMVILLAFLLLLHCCIEWIELREDIEEMRKFEEDEQREDDDTRAAAEDKR